MVRPMGETIAVVSWDLSGVPTRAAVGWPATATSDVYHLPRHSTVRLALPGGHEFAAEDVQAFVQAPGPRIRGVDVQTEPLPVPRAAAYASRLMREWGMDGPSLTGWRAAALASHAAGHGIPRTNRETAAPIADGGPIVGVQLFGSLDPQAPVIVEVGFFWPDVPSVP
jgi:hypothetical protein